jgi:hypothetical protein
MPALREGPSRVPHTSQSAAHPRTAHKELCCSGHRVGRLALFALLNGSRLLRLDNRANRVFPTGGLVLQRQKTELRLAAPRGEAGKVGPILAPPTGCLRASAGCLEFR